MTDTKGVKPFDLNKPFTTRDGRKAEIAWTDGGGVFPLMGRIKNSNGKWYAAAWKANGQFYDYEISTKDLVNTPEPTVATFINVYEACHGNNAWSSFDMAKAAYGAPLAIIRLLRDPVTRAPVSVCLIDPSTGEPIANRGEDQ